MTNVELWRCDACRAQWPPEQLKRVTDWQVTRRTSGRSRQGSSSGRSARLSRSGVSFGSSSRQTTGYTSGTTTQARHDSLICPKCLGRRRAQALVWTMALLAAGVAIVGWLGSQSSQPVQRNFVDKEPTRLVDNGNALSSTQALAPRNAEDTDASVVATKPDSTADSNPSVPAPAQVSQDAINQAVFASLDSGAPVRWSDPAGRWGYAVASTSQLYGNRECKSYRVTTMEPGANEPSSSVDSTACRNAGSGWQLDASPG